jgi:RNA polymerase sigma-70 factor (ECF subfamily)
MSDAGRAAEQAARASHARLVAILAARGAGLDAAQEALADAFAAALDAWPRRGVPQNPEAWLLVTARRAISHRRRHDAVRAAAAQTLAMLADTPADDPGADDAPHAIPDERLRLLFACAHPAVPEPARAPLMLQVVLGLSAERIGPAFLMTPSAMGQALVRAKAAIAASGAAFCLPERADMAARQDGVLAAIYAAYGAGWSEYSGADTTRPDLAEEALWLARLAAAIAPDQPEAQGLLALILYCEARRPARRDAVGRFVPLGQQDPSRWTRALIDEAEGLLARAAPMQAPGRFQLEAAIQSAHSMRRLGRPVPWDGIVTLYAALMQIAPTLGAALGEIAAIAERDGPAAALVRLEAIDPRAVASHQPYWALRAHLLTRLGHDARDSYARAIGLTQDQAVRAWLLDRAGQSAPG